METVHLQIGLPPDWLARTTLHIPDVLACLSLASCAGVDSLPGFLHCFLSLMDTWLLKAKYRRLKVLTVCQFIGKPPGNCLENKVLVLLYKCIS